MDIIVTMNELVGVVIMTSTCRTVNHSRLRAMHADVGFKQPAAVLAIGNSMMGPG
jgi:uncharacterized protein (DUF1697 family)